MMRATQPVQLVLIVAGLALAAGALATVAPGGGSATAGSGATIYVNNDRFCANPAEACSQPYAVQVDPGQTIQWLDGQAGGSHSVTQCTGDGSGCPAPGGFDSGTKSDPAGSYITQNFPDEGVYYFRCQVHGNSMRGIITVGNPATPTALPSPTPIISVTPMASATPTVTAAFSPTPTTTPSATPAESPRSDINCDGQTNSDDILALLKYRAQNSSAATAGVPCPPVGSAEGDQVKGDLNCDGLIDAGDAIIALRVWAGLSTEGYLPESCPAP